MLEIFEKTMKKIKGKSGFPLRKIRFYLKENQVFPLNVAGFGLLSFQSEVQKRVASFEVAECL